MSSDRAVQRRRGRPTGRPGSVARIVATSVVAGLAFVAHAAHAGDDLAEIRARGSLRILVPRQDSAEYLPRSGLPLEEERAHAASMAREFGVEVEWVYVDSFDDLLPALLAERGDLVVDNLTVTPQRSERVAFSAPVALVREQIVTRADDLSLRRPEDLASRRVAVRRSSSFWESLERLRERVPKLEIQAVPESQNVDEILSRVAKGVYDVTLADSNLVRPVLGYRRDLRVAFDLEGVAVIAWAMRPDAVKLRSAVDKYLTQVSVSAGSDLFKGDLPAIRKRGVLRVLTRNNAANYYIWNGQLIGFEYELVRELAKRLGLKLEVVVPPTHEDLLPWLREGRGDLVAASLTASGRHTREPGVVFSRRTNRVSEVIVARKSDLPLDGFDDLVGRRFHVRRNSHYWETLEELAEAGVELALVEAPAHLETEEIIERVASGEYDLTLADSHIVDIEKTWRNDIGVAMALGEPLDHGWAVRADNPKLLDAVNAYFRVEYRGTFYNVLANRYFREPKRIRRHAESRPRRAGRISPYDEHLRKYAATYGFDWRLIAAQMHQESRFDPKARSFAGARGLLQVMPKTAREVGIEDLEDLEDPEAGIHAGVRYLARLRDRFDEELPIDERTWFSLAAYNAGHGHVRDARNLARTRDLDPNRWFANVERAMLLKRRREIAANTRFGYCRCDEPVRYVREIRDRYRAYVQVVAGSRAPGSETALAGSGVRRIRQLQ